MPRQRTGSRAPPGRSPTCPIDSACAPRDHRHRVTVAIDGWGKTSRFSGRLRQSLAPTIIDWASDQHTQAGKSWAAVTAKADIGLDREEVRK